MSSSAGPWIRVPFTVAVTLTVFAGCATVSPQAVDPPSPAPAEPTWSESGSASAGPAVLPNVADVDAYTVAGDWIVGFRSSSSEPNLLAGHNWRTGRGWSRTLDGQPEMPARVGGGDKGMFQVDGKPVVAYRVQEANGLTTTTATRIVTVDTATGDTAGACTAPIAAHGFAVGGGALLVAGSRDPDTVDPSGRQVWNRVDPSDCSIVWTRDVGYRSSSATVGDDFVLTHSGDDPGQITSLDLRSGDRLWGWDDKFGSVEVFGIRDGVIALHASSRSLGRPRNAGWVRWVDGRTGKFTAAGGDTTGLVAFGAGFDDLTGNVVLLGAGELVAVTPAGGKRVWVKTDVDGNVRVVAVVAGRVFLEHGSDRVAVNAATGTIIDGDWPAPARALDADTGLYPGGNPPVGPLPPLDNSR